jgi:hypothetical protein
MNTPEVSMNSQRKAAKAPASPANKRPTRRRTHDRLTISLPIEVGAQLRADAKAAGAPSLSAYVAETLAQRARSRSFRDLLDEMFRENPMTDEEREWADAILDR